MQRKAARSEAERIPEMIQRPGTAKVKVKSTLATARKKDCDHHDTDKQRERLTKRKREREEKRDDSSLELCRGGEDREGEDPGFGRVRCLF